MDRTEPIGESLTPRALGRPATEMPRSGLARAASIAAGSMLAMAAAFWLWALAVGRLAIETRGVGGVVTAVLWTLYFFGVPIAAFLALGTGLLGAFRRRHSWRIAAAIGALVAATGLFWWWSLMKAGA